MWKAWRSISNTTLKVQDTAVWLVAVGATLFYIFYWKYMPEQVPLHWNGTGVIDDYADARGYIMLIIMMFFFWHGMYCQKSFRDLRVWKTFLEKNCRKRRLRMTGKQE